MAAMTRPSSSSSAAAAPRRFASSNRPRATAAPPTLLLLAIIAITCLAQPALGTRLLKWNGGGSRVTVVSVPSQPASIVAYPAQGPIIAPPIVVGTGAGYYPYPVTGGYYPTAPCGGAVVGCGGGGIYPYPTYGRRLMKAVAAAFVGGGGGKKVESSAK
jgi:hypothetical protein